MKADIEAKGGWASQEQGFLRLKRRGWEVDEKIGKRHRGGGLARGVFNGNEKHWCGMNFRR